MKVNGIEIVNPSDVLVADGRVYSVRDLLGEGEITVQKVAAPLTANGRVYSIAELEGGYTPGPGPEPGPEPGTKSKVKVVFHTGSTRPDEMVPHLTIDDFEIKDEYFPEHGSVLPVFSKTIYVENLDDIRFDGISLINNRMEDYLRICVTHEDYPGYGNLTVGWYTNEGEMQYETAPDTVTERVRRLYIMKTDSNIAIHFRQNDTPSTEPDPSEPEQPEYPAAPYTFAIKHGDLPVMEVSNIYPYPDNGNYFGDNYFILDPLEEYICDNILNGDTSYTIWINGEYAGYLSGIDPWGANSITAYDENGNAYYTGIRRFGVCFDLPYAKSYNPVPATKRKFQIVTAEIPPRPMLEYEFEDNGLLYEFSVDRATFDAIRNKTGVWAAGAEAQIDGMQISMATGRNYDNTVVTIEDGDIKYLSYPGDPWGMGWGDNNEVQTQNFTHLSIYCWE